MNTWIYNLKKKTVLQVQVEILKKILFLQIFLVLVIFF